MNAPLDDNQIDRQLADAFDSPPEANFDAWHRKYSEVVSLLNQDRTVLLLKRRKIMQRTLKIAATAAVIAVTWFGVSQFTGPVVHNTAYAENAFAEVVEQVKRAKTITWKTTFYNENFGEDDKTSWIDADLRHSAYRSPGLRWRGHIDDNGQIVSETLTDHVNLKELSWRHDQKKATVRHMAFGTEHNRSPPFDWLHEKTNVLIEWVGTKTVADRKVNVFRRTHNSKDGFYRGKEGIQTAVDFWIDAETKKLVRVQFPGENLFDPDEMELASKKPKPDAKFSWAWGAGWVMHDIDLDAEVDDPRFEMKTPEGYAVTTIERPTVSESDMTEYLGVLAECLGNAFPDSIISPPAISGHKFNHISDKAKEDRTAGEQKLLDITRRYNLARLNLMPFRHFIMDHTVKDTWRYIGKGIKLGDKERIVCWYKPNGATKYRAVYGDLSVRDIAAEDLPLKVKP